VEILGLQAGLCLEALTLSRAQGLQAFRTVESQESRVGGSDHAYPAASSDYGYPAADDDEDGARRYARLLISEIKLYHEQAVNDARRESNLLGRLGPEITRARHLYEERVRPAVRARGDFFEQELVRTLANGDPTSLGQST
jgi:hypothetical protein